MPKSRQQLSLCRGILYGNLVSLPQRPVFLAESPKNSPESPPVPTLPGVPIEDVNSIECPAYVPAKYELTAEEADAFRKIQVETANVIKAMKLQGLLTQGTSDQVRARIRKAVDLNVKIPPIVDKTLSAKMKGPEHVFTIDAGNRYIVINIAAKQAGEGAPIKRETYIDIIEKNLVPDDMYGIKKDVGKFLAFRTKAVAELEKLPTRKDIRTRGQALIDGTPGLQELMSVANVVEKSNHLFSKRLLDGELVNIRLYRDTEHGGKLSILILPWKAPKKRAPAAKPAN